MPASYSYYLTVWDKDNMESKQCTAYQPELSNFAANVLGISPNLLHLLTLDSEKHRQGFEKLNLLIMQQHYGSLTCLFTEQPHLRRWRCINVNRHTRRALAESHHVWHEGCKYAYAGFSGTADGSAWGQSCREGGDMTAFYLYPHYSASDLLLHRHLGRTWISLNGSFVEVSDFACEIVI